MNRISLLFIDKNHKVLISFKLTSLKIFVKIQICTPHISFIEMVYYEIFHFQQQELKQLLINMHKL